MNLLKYFQPEDEDLKDTTNQRSEWKQYNLYVRGKKIEENCKKAPVTCALIDQIEPAKSCSRGQVKFSVMNDNLHVWPHCGPSNCRLRSHLGLKIPKNSGIIRIFNQTQQWTEGKFIIFDDS